MCSGSAVQLLGHWSHRCRQRYLEVIATASQVDEIRIVRVAQDAIEEPLAECLAVTTEYLEGATSQCRGRNGGIAVNHRRSGAADKIKGLFAAQEFTATSDVVLRRVGLWGWGLVCGAWGLAWGLGCGAWGLGSGAWGE